MYGSDKFSVTALFWTPVTKGILKDHYSEAAVREKVTSAFLFNVTYGEACPVKGAEEPKND